MRELFNYIESLDKIYERVKVDQSDVKLRKLSEGSEKTADFTNDKVQDFLTALTSSIRKTDDK
jgi:replication-associated recombination protein RarA